MRVTWYGHSCFVLETHGGTRLLLDPCDPDTGYALDAIAADAVCVTHAHHDHSYTAAAAGNPLVIQGPGEYSVKDVRITGYPSWHDGVQGAQRGPNVIYLIQAEGRRVCHLGDLGALPEESVLEALSKPDLLLIPVGGRYTIDASAAAALTARLEPAVVTPMHYRTAALTFPLADAEEFIKLLGDSYRVQRLDRPDFTLPEPSEQGILLAPDYVR